MALSFVKWVVSEVAIKKCSYKYICKFCLWVMCSARQYVHEIKDLLTKQRACVFYLYEQGVSLLVDILFLFPYS